MGKIAIVGSSNTDLVIKTNRIPVPGETVIGGDFIIAAGGKGANQAVAVARLGGEALLIAKIGNDTFGSLSLEGYANDNLDTTFVSIDAETPSGVAIISVDSKGENCIVVAPGANNKLSKENIDSAKHEIKVADYVLMQLEIPMEVVEYAVDMAYEADVKVVLNPAPASLLSDELLAKLFLITPNRAEAEMLTGVKISDWNDASKAASCLLNKGVKNVIITLGSMGAYIKSESIDEIVPALRVVAVDTTAAGDVFNGALCVALSEGNSLIDAVKFASKASSISVTRMGAQKSIPFRNEMPENLTNNEILKE